MAIGLKIDETEIPDVMLHCKKCDNIVQKYDKYCGNCGRKLKIPKEFGKLDWKVKV